MFQVFWLDICREAVLLHTRDNMLGQEMQCWIADEATIRNVKLPAANAMHQWKDKYAGIWLSCKMRRRCVILSAPASVRVKKGWSACLVCYCIPLQEESRKIDAEYVRITLISFSVYKSVAPQLWRRGYDYWAAPQGWNGRKQGTNICVKQRGAAMQV